MKVADLDLSYGDGVLHINRSSVSGMQCVEFKFDRASRRRDSELVDCDFRQACAYGFRHRSCPGLSSDVFFGGEPRLTALD